MSSTETGTFALRQTILDVWIENGVERRGFRDVVWGPYSEEALVTSDSPPVTRPSTPEVDKKREGESLEKGNLQCFRRYGVLLTAVKGPPKKPKTST
jgi:hypothetical protein